MVGLYTSEDGVLSFRKSFRLFAALRFGALFGRERDRFRDASDRGLPWRDSVPLAIMLRANSDEESDQDKSDGPFFFRGKDEHLARPRGPWLHEARGRT